MTISDSEKIDFLWKKIIYGVSKTANALVKSGSNETVASPITTYSQDIWTQASQIPTPAPAANTAVVSVYTATNSIKMTVNPTSPANVSWLSNMEQFVPPTFDPSYLVQVYGGNPNTGAPRLFPDTTSYEYVFDYVSGTLEFDNLIPASVVANGVYIQAYQYTGSTLDQTLNAISVAASAAAPSVVANIAARNAMSPVSGDIVHVLDASGDPVNAGPGMFADYIWTGTFWQCIATSASARTNALTQDIYIAATNFAAGTDLIANVGGGTRVVEVSVEVSTAFDGGADITIGDSGNNQRLVDDTTVDLSTTGTYVITPVYQFPIDQETGVNTYFTGNPTVGNAKVTITWA